MESASKNELINKLYDNMLCHTKHLTNLLVILNGTGAVTVFTIGNKQYNSSLLLFISGILSVVITLAISYGFMCACIRKIHKNEYSPSYIALIYNNYLSINLLGIASSTLCLFMGLSYGYNIIYQF